MNHTDDDIDAVLRGQFEGAVADDGFADRVMQQVPPRRRAAVSPVVAGMAAGIGASWFSLLPSSLLRVGWLNWISGDLSASAIILMVTVAGMSLLACWWTTMEPDGH